MAKEENAHEVAERIHSLVLQNFTSGTVERLDAHADEHMTVEEGEEEVEDSEGNSTEDEKTCDDEHGSLFKSQSAVTNATSIESSLVASADPAADPHQQNSHQLELGQQLIISNATYPPHLAGSLAAEQTNGVYLVSANL